MKLYGVAIAVTGEGPREITCSTIVVDSEKRTHVERVEDKCFKTTADWENCTTPKTVFTTFTRIVDVMYNTLQLQKVSFAEGTEYRPLAITIGSRIDASLSLRALMLLLFERKINFAANELMIRFAEDPESLSRDECDLMITNVYKLLAADYISHLDDEEKALLEETYFKFAEVLKGSYLKWGQYNPLGSVDAIREYYEAMPWADTLNTALIQFKKDLDADVPFTLEKIKSIARLYRARVFTDPNIFIDAAPWPDYTTNQNLQKRFPIYCFLNWHPDIRAAFIEDFEKSMKATYGVRHSLSVKTSLDPKTGLFTEGCYRVILDQIRLMEGEKSQADIIMTDETKWRHRLLFDTEKNCGGLRYF